MKIEILPEASEDLIAGFHFYEKQSHGLGSYFHDSLFADIDSLLVYGGIHPVVFDSYRCLARRFPFAIYYVMEGEIIRVQAVFDCRRNPARIKGRLKGR